MPVLVMSGLRDTKYSAIAERMADLIPCAELSSIDHAGHNPIADAPGEAYAAISAFLDRNS